MLKDFNDYAKYTEFMNAYEDELYELCTESPRKWQKIKMQLGEKQYDLDSDDRIFLAAMEATEFSARIMADRDYIENHPLLKELDEIEIYDDDYDE